MHNSPMTWMVLTVCVLLPGCCNESKAGDACTPGKAACADRVTELVCQDGKLAAAPCRGPKGCSIHEDKQRCDISGNAEGDVCPLVNEGRSQCSIDPRKMVVCKAGKYELHQCRGPKGCDSSTGKVECDRSLQMESDKCLVENTFTCSMDNKRMLMCKAGKYVIDEYCRGPKACDATGDKAVCDRGPQNIGEPCRRAGELECSTDEQTILVCRANRWEVEQKCPGKCKRGGEKAACE